MSEDYKKFRHFFTSSGKLVIGGKSAEQNEDLVNEIIKQAEKDEVILHTKEAGSPFVNIKNNSKERCKRTTKKDIKEAAVFCARYSHDWRDNKKDVIVHYFSGKSLYKGKGMKRGTFAVGTFKEIKINKKEIEKFIKEQSEEAEKQK